ncbi:STAS domain-containing protein [Paenibacillus sp. 481]|uniref:STAS domain-containing protein n=1 Tax=Paenibacillus sp. 481 TaxID=2835869 RepID=UPI001E5A1708|nr:STAS domain-containing protein [Paenibacillus sp. 481]UHA74767.1 STAS domain-containing protein [Paenibacillus sp. 481]
MSNRFSVTMHKTENHVVIGLQGDLDLAAAGEFRAHMEPIVNDSTIELTLDLERLTYIDSTGIGILISILKVRHGMQSPFHIINVPQYVQKLFKMTGISKFLTPTA